MLWPREVKKIACGIGDQPYELDYARRLGANTFGVHELEDAAPRSGKG